MKLGVAYYFHKGQNKVVVQGYEGLAELKLDYKFLPNIREYSAEDLSGVDVVLTTTGEERITASTMAGNGSLIANVRAGAGFDAIDHNAASAEGVVIATAGEAVTYPTAVAALVLLLNATLRLKAKDAINCNPARWPELEKQTSWDLRHKTVGLLGYGKIARELKRLLAPLGPKIIAYDPFLSTSPDDTHLVSMDTLLAQSDIVSLHTPLNDETRDLMNAARFAKMKRGAILVNTCRGGVVDELALAAALASGHVAGAALDVLKKEPPEAGNPLLNRENVVLSAHALNWTEHTEIDIAHINVSQIRDLVAGRHPKAIVNPGALTHPKWQGKA